MNGCSSCTYEFKAGEAITSFDFIHCNPPYYCRKCVKDGSAKKHNSSYLAELHESMKLDIDDYYK